MDGMELNQYRKRVGNRFSKASMTYDESAIAQRAIARTLSEILRNYLAHHASGLPRNGLEIGCGTGLLTRHLQSLCPSAHWVLNDIQEAGKKSALSYCAEDTEFICQDAESLETDRHFQLIASASTFQWFARPDRMIERFARWQSAGDVLLFSTFLPDNLREVRQLTGIGLSYPTSGDWRRWLERDYIIHHQQEERLTLCFDTPMQVLLHLKQTGVTGTNSGVWSAGKLRSFCEAYTHLYRTSGNQVTLTYQPMYVLAERI